MRPRCRSAAQTAQHQQQHTHLHTHTQCAPAKIKLNGEQCCCCCCCCHRQRSALGQQSGKGKESEGEGEGEGKREIGALQSMPRPVLTIDFIAGCSSVCVPGNTRWSALHTLSDLAGHITAAATAATAATDDLDWYVLLLLDWQQQQQQQQKTAATPLTATVAVAGQQWKNRFFIFLQSFFSLRLRLSKCLSTYSLFD